MILPGGPRGVRGTRKALLAFIALTAGLAGCSAGTGIHHRVERGQTAYRIATVYGIDTRTLLEANRIADPRTLRPGQLLWVPGADRTRTVPPTVDVRDTSSIVSSKRLVIPVRGTISSGFGKRGGRMHEGIDILAPEGTEVRAAGYGVVLYAGDGLRGYGKAVVLDHGDGVTTLYGHLKRFRVQSGDVVAREGVIGTVGDTGNATTPHLHFELRLEEKGLDPEYYMEIPEDRE